MRTKKPFIILYGWSRCEQTIPKVMSYTVQPLDFMSELKPCGATVYKGHMTPSLWPHCAKCHHWLPFKHVCISKKKLSLTSTGFKKCKLLNEMTMKNRKRQVCVHFLRTLFIGCKCYNYVITPFLITTFAQTECSNKLLQGAAAHFQEPRATHI